MMTLTNHTYVHCYSLSMPPEMGQSTVIKVITKKGAKSTATRTTISRSVPSSHAKSTFTGLVQILFV